jgi:hypothetical protein
LNVFVTPDPKVLRTDPALGKDSRCLSKHQSSAAHGPATQMDEMPVIGVPIAAGVLAHGRDEYPIGELEISNRERIKQVSHKSYSVFLNRRLRKKLLPMICCNASIR